VEGDEDPAGDRRVERVDDDGSVAQVEGDDRRTVGERGVVEHSMVPPPMA
jgi:hypothetical protein